MSDRSNTAAAFDFLREIESRKEHIEEPDTQIVSFRPRRGISYQTSAGIKEKLPGLDQVTTEEDKPILKGSKVVMPEYVIGQKIKKDRKKRTTPIVVNHKALKLDHLLEEDDNE